DTTWQQTSDKTVYDKFNDGNKPIHATTHPENGPSQSVDISYDGGTSTWQYDDGSIVKRNAKGDTTWQQTSDKTVYDKFNDGNKPIHATTHPENGPSQSVDISYDGGTSTWQYDDGSIVKRNAKGDTTWQQTSDKTVYDKFNDGNKPIHATTHPENGPSQNVDISYDGGTSTWQYDDGSIVKRNAKGDTTWQQTSDKTVYDKFNDGNKPIHATTHPENGPSQNVDISYDGGTSTWQYDDGSIVKRNAKGDTTWQQTTDKTIYDEFNYANKPTHGTTHPEEGPPQTIDVKYNGEGSEWTYTDTVSGEKTVITRNKENDPVLMVTDGWTFGFDKQGRPNAGTKGGGDNGPAESVTIQYDGGRSTWTYKDAKGETTKVTKEGDKVVSMESGGWTFNDFDKQGRPKSGTKPGKPGEGPQSVTIKYDANGSVWSYTDSKGAVSSVVTKDATGKVTKLEQGGWTYNEFDDDGRPLHGTKGGEKVDIKYTASGLIESTFYDGKGKSSTIVTDQNGRPIFQIVDGIPAEFAVEIPKLDAARAAVEKQRGLIEANLKGVATFLDAISSGWSSPSGKHYATLADRLKTVNTEVLGVLSDSITAMKKAHQNYVDAEGGNLLNLTPASSSQTFVDAKNQELLNNLKKLTPKP
ncbi:hypothetical protein, partial [Actinoplanes sp. NPDC049265]|uniref:hypothetical protein n=1 Tax=Actinoplanes sp. NPDC049265 TaxID=3363902 RepID=UPI0037159E0F